MGIGSFMRYFVRATLVFVAVACIPSAPASAQEVTAPMLKAAFLYNFTKFAEWPSSISGPTQPLTMCVIGDGGVAAALEQTIRENPADGHPLVVTVLKTDAAVSSCHVLYVAASEVKRATATLARLHEEPVLTVSDAKSFAVTDGIAELIVQRNQIRFALNPGSARRAKLHLSSRLLRLAQLVGEDANDSR
jgi:hypothetical protein